MSQSNALARTLLRTPVSVARLFATPRTVVDGLELDPQLQLFLRILAANGAPPLDEMPLHEAREAYGMLAGITARPPVPPPRSAQIQLEGPAGPMRALVHWPSLREEPRPAVVYFHGGGYTIGSPEDVEPLCHRIAAQAGVVVINVDYRLAPEHPFPAAVDDALAAFIEVHRRAGELGIDPERIAVAGDSAGAALSAAVSVLQRDAGGPMPAYQLLFYPGAAGGSDAYESMSLFADGFFLTRNSIRFFHDCYESGGAGDFRSRVLLTPDLSRLPHTRIVTAGFDPLRDEGDALAARLLESGVRVSHDRRDSLLHGFVIFDFCDEARAAVSDALDELRDVLFAPDPIRA